MKLPSLPLFTDTFTAETVHLSNNKIGIYIRLLCFAWTKNAKPFTTESAFRICQCLDDQCCIDVYEVLQEFFIVERECDDRHKKTWVHKRLLKEYGFVAHSEWWFGLDFNDLYRSINIMTAKKNNSGLNNMVELFYNMVDEMQIVVDKKKMSSEVHMLFKRKRV